ncbi:MULTISPECIES: putative Na+/H+ antiporter [Hydrocarboniphaga]|jgi:hypothetical protein|uniref:Na+/H+ antiporter n=1 Tax=Hydrocarboniphaga effusa AP103 TaxID=1172194 RepID=I8HXZ6_9GAMM|nr:MULTISPECIES: putative Na+/H+ antiporter [Hydrocarboniphaga]EIT68326.1 hypothetical protein WQQ_35210 [Hydrocarboniphaga effusa AP103]MDZ4078690.1 putative Na+/H+ antiporter [Hydrocarboniphaga sp.]
MNPSLPEIIGTALFAVAILHTFLASRFEKLAERNPANAGIWHLLGEVEAVFGFWALVFTLFLVLYAGSESATHYLEGLNYTEAMFVFVIMVIAASRPILVAAGALVRMLSFVLPMPTNVATYFVLLSVVPLLGSFITEPAAMTLAALMLRDQVYSQPVSARLKYATLGVLFVNVSIGGTLTPYAAPPVLMVAGVWGWDITHMMSTFGWKAAIAVVVNAAAATLLFRGELRGLPLAGRIGARVPVLLILVHLAFLAGVVVFAHHPTVFIAMFLFFLGVADAYERHNDRLMLREGLLVAFFLAGLVTLGAQQRWWLQDLLTGLDPTVLFFGATALTAITDNAALTYLGSLVQGIDDAFKYALVAGAVTGGGLTVIANAPNPAGFSILKDHFDDGAISAGGLFVAALGPTLVTVAAFLLL